MVKYRSHEPTGRSRRKIARERDPSARLREIPSVDELLARPRLAALAEKAGRADRDPILPRGSRRIARRTELSATNHDAAASNLDPAAIETRIVAHVEAFLAPSLVHVINATGVILHTNLGRAPLSAAAAAQIAEAADALLESRIRYRSGERGKRDVHTARLLAATRRRGSRDCRQQQRRRRISSS